MRKVIVNNVNFHMAWRASRVSEAVVGLVVKGISELTNIKLIINNYLVIMFQ